LDSFDARRFDDVAGCDDRSLFRCFLVDLDPWSLDSIKFSGLMHKSVIAEKVKAELKLRNEAKSESEMTSRTSKLSCDDRRTILRGQETGQWLSQLPSTVNGAELSAQEFRDAPLLRSARGPPDSPPFCDGCNQKFSVRHALEGKKGVSSSSDLFLPLPFLQSQCDEPKILTCRSPEVKSDEEIEDNSVERGLWARDTDCSIAVRISNFDAESNRSKDPDKVLAAHEHEKKEVPRGLPRATSAFFSVCGVCGWSLPRQRSQDLAEETIRRARQEVGETPVRSLRL
jgi:hypothetical protein